DVVEEHVDAAFGALLERLVDVLVLVVDGGVEAQLLDEIAALGGAAGKADDAAALQARDLSDERAYCPGGAPDADGLARLGLADVEQPEVGGDAGHAERAEPARQRSEAGVDLVEVLGVRYDVRLHAGDAGDDVAGDQLGIVGGDDAATPERAHDLAQLHRWHVRAHVVHPAAHGGIERQIFGLDEHLTGAGHGHRSADELEVAAL